MNIDYIKNILKNNNFSENNLKVAYDFESDLNLSGFVYNQAYSGTNQIESLNNNLIVDLKYNPGKFYTSDKSFTNGSTLFSYGARNTIDSELIILDFEYFPQLSQNNSRILSHIFETNKYDILIGINDHHRLYIEHSGINFFETKTFSSLLRDNNILNLFFSSNSLKINLFDPNKNYTYESNTVGIKNNLFKDKTIYFGNTSLPRDSYTGFFGNIKQIYNIDYVSSESLAEEINLLLFKTGEVEEKIQVQQSKKVFSSGIINPNAIIGTGITGYVNVYDENLNAFVVSGVTGNLYGEAIEYLNQETVLISEEINITKNLYNQTILNTYGNKNIYAQKLFSENNYLDINTFNFSKKIYSPKFINANYCATHQDLNENINLHVYLNGLLLPKTDYDVALKGFTIKNYILDKEDTVLYTISNSGSYFYYEGLLEKDGEDYYLDPPLQFNTEIDLSLNLYLNGKKLNTSIDYNIQKNTYFENFVRKYKYNINWLFLNYQDGPVGKLLVTSDEILNRFGGNLNISNNEIIISDINKSEINGLELLWINGVLQKEGADYLYAPDFNNFKTFQILSYLDNTVRDIPNDVV